MRARTGHTLGAPPPRAHCQFNLHCAGYQVGGSWPPDTIEPQSLCGALSWPRRQCVTWLMPCRYALERNWALTLNCTDPDIRYSCCEQWDMIGTEACQVTLAILFPQVTMWLRS